MIEDFESGDSKHVILAQKGGQEELASLLYRQVLAEVHQSMEIMRYDKLGDSADFSALASILVKLENKTLDPQKARVDCRKILENRKLDKLLEDPDITSNAN